MPWFLLVCLAGAGELGTILYDESLALKGDGSALFSWVIFGMARSIVCSLGVVSWTGPAWMVALFPSLALKYSILPVFSPRTCAVVLAPGLDPGAGILTIAASEGLGCLARVVKLRAISLARVLTRLGGAVVGKDSQLELELKSALQG